MKFKCNNCKRETDLDAGDILSIGGHPLCCDQDMESLGEPPPVKIQLFIPVGDSAQAFSTVPCTVHFHDEDNPSDSDFPDVHTVEAEVVTQEEMDKMVEKASEYDVDYKSIDSIKAFIAKHEVPDEYEFVEQPRDPNDAKAWKTWLRNAGIDIRDYIKEHRG